MARARKPVKTRKGTRFEKLVAWQKAYELVIEIYAVTKAFPPEERFGLSSQVRRSAVSVPSNIAVGWGRGSTADYLRFLDIARGSTYELQTQLWLAADLAFLGEDDPCHGLVVEVRRLLNGLIRSLRTKLEN